MSLLDVYPRRLDLCICGYSKQNIKSEIPNDVIKMIKTWHSDNQVAKLKLVFSLLLITQRDYQVVFESYLKGNDLNLLDVSKYSFSSSVMFQDQNDFYCYEQIDQDIDHIYDNEQYLSYMSIKIGRKSLKGDFNVIARDSMNNVIAESKIELSEYRCYDKSKQLLVDARLSSIDVNKNGRLSLNEWVALKHENNISDNDFLWKRVFYFANFMSQRESDYRINERDFNIICEAGKYELKEFDDFVQKLVTECDVEILCKFII